MENIDLKEVGKKMTIDGESRFQEARQEEKMKI